MIVCPRSCAGTPGSMNATSNATTPGASGNTTTQFTNTTQTTGTSGEKGPLMGDDHLGDRPFAARAGLQPINTTQTANATTGAGTRRVPTANLPPPHD
jgi:hypothetical protein